MLNFEKFPLIIQNYILQILQIQSSYHLSLCNKKLSKLFSNDNIWSHYLKRDFLFISFNENIPLSSKEKY